MNSARALSIATAAFLLLSAAAVLASSDARAADDGAFYIVYGHIRMSDGQPVPDGTRVTARNLDRTDDNTMYFDTETDSVSAGRYTVNMHTPGMPESYNSMAFSDGDRIRITCSLGDETASVTHVIDVSSGTTKQVDFMLEPVPDVDEDDSWYDNPVTLGIIAVVVIVAGVAVWYLFVPPKDGR